MSDILKFIESLKSENESERSYAVTDLGNSNNELAIDPLVELLLRETSVIIKESIFKSLAKIDGEKTIEALIFLLRSDEAFIRNQAITILNEKGVISLEPLRKLLKDPDKDVRKLALDALFSFEHPEAANIIIEAFDDLAINVRITAVEYIGKLEAKQYADMVLDIFLKSENIVLTCSCLETLAVIGNEKSIEAINNKFSDLSAIDPLALFSYIKILGAFGNLDSMEIMAKFLENFGIMMSKEIIQSIQKITTRLKLTTLPTDLVEIFIFISNDFDEMEEYSVLSLFSNYDNQEIFDLFVQKVKSEKRMVKLGAIEGLGKLRNPDAIPILEELLESEEDEELIEVITDSIDSLK